MVRQSRKVPQRQRVFERLMAGETIDQIRVDTSSDSALQRGIQAYVEKWRKDMPEFQGEIRALELKRKELDDDLLRLSGEVGESERKRDELEGEVNARRSELDALKVWLAEERSNFAELNGVLNDIRAKGVTDEAISRIGLIDFGEGDELLERINTVESHQELVRRNRILEAESRDRLKDYRDLSSKLKSLAGEVASQENALDDVQLRRRLHEEAYVVVQGFLQEGYDADLLLSLLEPLKALSVKGQPSISLERFAAGLRGYKTLMELEDAVASRQTELSKLNQELQESQATLKAVKDYVLGELEDAKNTSINMITVQTNAALGDMKKLEEGYQTSMNDLKDASITSLKEEQESHVKTLDQLKDLGMGYVERVSNSSLIEIRSATQSLKTTIEAYESAIRRWGEEKEKLGELKDVLPYAQVIHDAILLKDNVGIVPLDVMRLLVRYVNLWIRVKEPDTMIKPYDYIAKSDRNISHFYKYRLKTLIDIVDQFFFSSV